MRKRTEILKDAHEIVESFSKNSDFYVEATLEIINGIEFFKKEIDAVQFFNNENFSKYIKKTRDFLDTCKLLSINEELSSKRIRLLALISELENLEKEDDTSKKFYKTVRAQIVKSLEIIIPELKNAVQLLNEDKEYKKQLETKNEQAKVVFMDIIAYFDPDDWELFYNTLFDDLSIIYGEIRHFEEHDFDIALIERGGEISKQVIIVFYKILVNVQNNLSRVGQDIYQNVEKYKKLLNMCMEVEKIFYYSGFSKLFKAIRLSILAVSQMYLHRAVHKFPIFLSNARKKQFNEALHFEVQYTEGDKFVLSVEESLFANIPENERNKKIFSFYSNSKKEKLCRDFEPKIVEDMVYFQQFIKEFPKFDLSQTTPTVEAIKDMTMKNWDDLFCTELQDFIVDFLPNAEINNTKNFLWKYGEAIEKELTLRIHNTTTTNSATFFIDHLGYSTDEYASHYLPHLVTKHKEEYKAFVLENPEAAFNDEDYRNHAALSGIKKILPLLKNAKSLEKSRPEVKNMSLEDFYLENNYYAHMEKYFINEISDYVDCVILPDMTFRKNFGKIHCIFDIYPPEKSDQDILDMCDEHLLTIDITTVRNGKSEHSVRLRLAKFGGVISGYSVFCGYLKDLCRGKNSSTMLNFIEFEQFIFLVFLKL